MALIRDDRVAETSTTIGAGALTLAAAITGYRRFSAVCAVADTVYYMVEAVDANNVPTGEFETGLGTYSAADTLTRTTVHKSSNANAAVVFAAGTKRVVLAMTSAALTALTTLRFGSFATGAILASEVLMDHIITDTCTLADDFVGSRLSCGTNPAATWTATVLVNGVSVGTIALSTAGVATLVTTGTTVPLVAGDVVTVTAPVTADANIARVRFTFRGTI